MKDATRIERYRWFADPGKAWLQVPLGDLVEAGAVDRISGDSRMTASNAYLDEDRDVPAFLEAAAENGLRVAYRLPVRQFDSAPMRSFGRFDAFFARNPVTEGLAVGLADGRDARIESVIMSSAAPVPGAGAEIRLRSADDPEQIFQVPATRLTNYLGSPHRLAPALAPAEETGPPEPEPGRSPGSAGPGL